ncbi:unnamed protein product [Pieris brassicae]|uniref:PiggyBac transposable element-derived protein domain-containing protein n=1 Tax=Pieris brassicae TaxID=7116 RepID=A0A9P0XKY6_PIEBR|nr:unnamed protein product [Pieris brassicae]
MKLSEKYLDADRSIATDKFYTSVDLAKCLLNRSTHLLGTVRKIEEGCQKTLFPQSYKKGFRSNKILCLLKGEHKPFNVGPDGNTTKKIKPGPPAITHNKKFDPPMKQNVIDKHERILMEKQYLQNLYKKSLSLSDLAQDDQKQSTKRQQSAPPAADIILDYSCVSPSIAFGFYFNDYPQVNEEPQLQNINESTTDCETSEDDYGNVNEVRKRRNIAKKDEWKKLKAQRKRMRGEEYLGYSKLRRITRKYGKTRYDQLSKWVIHAFQIFAEEANLEVVIILKKRHANPFIATSGKLLIGAKEKCMSEDM